MVHVLMTVPSRYGEVGVYSVPTVIRVNSRYAGRSVRLGIGYVAAAGSARQRENGPLVPGPWAYSFPLATVIDNYGGTAAESARMQAEGTEVDVEIGALFALDGMLWTITDDAQYDYPKLTLVPAEVPA